MIRVDNLYMMLAYAWNRLDHAGLVDVSTLSQKNLQNLLARVLCSGVRSLLHRGQQKVYIESDGEMSTLRGRVDMTASISSGALSRAKMVCVYDEYSLDTLSNQIIRSTMRMLAGCEDVAKELRAELRGLCLRFGAVSDLRVTEDVLRIASRQHHTSLYGLLLDICRMAFGGLMPAQTPGQYRFRDFFRDEGKMRLLFQAFLYRFYQKELIDFSVHAKQVEWDITDPHGHEHLLPTMRTDVSMWSPARHIIVEAKYTAKVFQQYYNKKTLQSEHLYQISTYLHQRAKQLSKNAEGADEGISNRIVPEGILLYPLADDYVDAEYNIGGYRLTVVTVDLQKDWGTIHKRLLDIVQR